MALYAASVAGRRNRMAVLGLLLLLLAGLSFSAGATSLSGRISSTSFIYETYGEDSAQEWDLLNRLSLDARDLGHESVSLHFLGTFRGELLEDQFDNSQMRFYRGYLKFAPRKELNLSVGRQWVFGGVGSSLLDGVKLRLARKGLGDLTLYAGSRELIDENGDDTFPNFEDMTGVVGAHYRYCGLPLSGVLGLSAVRFTEEIDEDGKTSDQLVEQRVGVSARFLAPKKVRVAYELRYETESEKIYFQHLRLTQRRGSLNLGLTWNLKDGYLPFYSDSWIVREVRDQEWFSDEIGLRRHELRAQADFPCLINPDLRMSVALVEIFPEEGDRGDGLELSLRGYGATAGLRVQRGYRGDRTGFFGNYRHEVLDGTWLWADLNRVAWNYGDEDISELAVRDDYSMATRLGLDHRFDAWSLDLRLIFESLTTPRAEYENRFIGMISWDFDTSAGEEY